MAASDLLRKVKEGLQGKPLMSHPIHVALVHFPMAFVPAGFIFDAMAASDRKYRDLYQAGYYANLFGIISSVPTAATGVAEWVDIPQDHPAWLTATTHAALNDVVLALSVYNWWTRRDRRGFQADQTNLVLGGVATALLGISGWLGGLLVYDHGLGVQRQGTAIESHREDEEWERTHNERKPAAEPGSEQPGHEQPNSGVVREQGDAI